MYQAWQDIYIIFDKNRFQIVQRIFGIKIEKSESLENILAVLLSKSDCLGVIIFTKGNNYTIGSGLKEIEVAWLAQEIQDWLYDR